jgi:cob(I)alamin adenosyltransferase
MGHRLSRIYTRTGDDGTTGLADGSRVLKDDLRIECIGTVDELNSVLGVALAAGLPEAVNRMLAVVQHRLFDLGGELSLPGYDGVRDADITELESWIDGLNADLPPLKEFILPAGSTGAAHCHLARTVCRRAERQLISLHRKSPMRQQNLRFLNRLSDLLFVAARAAARATAAGEVYWQKR